MKPNNAAPELRPPAYLWVPDHAKTYGPEVADLCDSVGMNLDAEQRLVLDGMFAAKANDQWAAIEDGEIVARQNLKTHVLKAAAVGHLLLFDARVICWSAHLFKTTQEAHRDLKAIFTDYDALRRRVKKITDANGEEAIELFGDRRILFSARTNTGGRGLTGDVNMLDEAFALKASEMGSLIPALSARPNPKIVYASSGCHKSSAILRTVRDRGRAGGDPALFYVEWCADPPADEWSPEAVAAGDACASKHCDHRYGSPGCLLDDENRWRQANPAEGRRIRIDFLRTERRTLPAQEFAREVLTWHEPPDEESVDGLPLEKWMSCVDADSEIEDDLVFAVSVAHDQSWATIAAAGTYTWDFEGDDGKAEQLVSVHAEVVEYRRDTDWIADRLAELLQEHGGAGRVFYDGAGPRCTVPDELEAAGVVFETVTKEQLVEACGFLETLIKRDGALKVLDQPELTFAVKGGRRRFVGDAWTWARRASPVEISPIVGVTIAAWAVINGAESDDSVYEERGLVTL